MKDINEDILLHDAPAVKDTAGELEMHFNLKNTIPESNGLATSSKSNKKRRICDEQPLWRA